jgi:hypothetical protein
MRKVALNNKSGQQVTEININAGETEKVDGIQWGSSIFIWDENLQHFREASIKPAIVIKNKK